jgi:hypothetical protein
MFATSPLKVWSLLLGLIALNFYAPHAEASPARTKEDLFFSSTRFAVVGASDDESKFGTKVCLAYSAPVPLA